VPVGPADGLVLLGLALGEVGVEAGVVGLLGEVGVEAGEVGVLGEVGCGEGELRPWPRFGLCLCLCVYCGTGGLALCFRAAST
jgi:hypothetical protein